MEGDCSFFWSIGHYQTVFFKHSTMESLPQAIRLRSSPKFQTVTSVRQAVNKFFNQEQTDAEAAPPPEKKARK